PAHCGVSAKNAPSRTKIVRSVRILGSLPCTARVLPDPFLNGLCKLRTQAEELAAVMVLADLAR
ncbi:MAG: hypothetical protein ACYCYO_15480, partial [Bacilli bacterium]